MMSKLTDHDPSELEFEEQHAADAYDLKVEAENGDAWYFSEQNGPCRPGFDEGHTTLFINSEESVTVSIDIWNGETYDEHDVEYTLMETETGDTNSEDARTDGGESERWDVTEPADTSEYVPLDMANNITDERVQDRIQWVDGFGRAYADALPDSEGDDAAESGELVADGGVEADGGDDPRDTWRVRMGEDGEPTMVSDEEMGVAARYEREDGDSEGSVTYMGPDGESITIQPGDTILGPDGEDVVTVTGFRVTTAPWLSVEAFVDLPPEKGGGVPMSPHSFAIRFLGYEDSDGFHYHVGECVAASGEELEQARWSDELETLRSVSEGDTLTWGDRSEPLTVTDTFLTFSKVVEVTGPSGARYTIEWKDGTPSVRRGGEDGRSLGRPHGLAVAATED